MYSDPVSTWGVVALKSAHSAKSRLKEVLCDSDRRELFFIMARTVIIALRDTPTIDRVLVVTACGEVERFATELGAEVLRQSEDHGTAAAFAYAVANLCADAAANQPMRLLMINGDLPLLAPVVLSKLLTQLQTDGGVCVVPDRKRVGTNALLCSPRNAIPPCFGIGSFDRHLSIARERRVAVRILESEALSLDIDGADDLMLLRTHLSKSSGTGDHAELRTWMSERVRC
jgi:2-phospho-L-lactate/phosphoenolpyruvate guanylyltransferase